MPDIDGIQLAIDFTSRFPNCKVLLLSGQTYTTDLLEIARQQGYDFPVVAKPIHLKDLLAAIDGLTA
jgi:DNA-binding NtrC family response regulator